VYFKNRFSCPSQTLFTTSLYIKVTVGILPDVEARVVERLFIRHSRKPCMDVWKKALFNSSACSGWQALHFTNAPLAGGLLSGSAKNTAARAANMIVIRMYVL
jgi:hypothetical protein